MSSTATPNAGSSPYSTLPPASTPATRKPVSLPRLQELHARGEKITMLTAYDATFAAVADTAGVETILVGDSLGMVCQGLPSTVGVTLETMRYHTESVTRGLRRVYRNGPHVARPHHNTFDYGLSAYVFHIYLFDPQMTQIPQIIGH